MSETAEPGAFQLERPPTGWLKLDREDRDSTVAWFKGGYVHVEGVEVLIWRGDGPNGDIPTTHEDYDPERHKFIIEVLTDGERTRQFFTEHVDDAWRVANSLIQHGHA